jgi:hypothetical protein
MNLKKLDFVNPENLQISFDVKNLFWDSARDGIVNYSGKIADVCTNPASRKRYVGWFDITRAEVRDGKMFRSIHDSPSHDLWEIFALFFNPDGTLKKDFEEPESGRCFEFYVVDCLHISSRYENTDAAKHVLECFIHSHCTRNSLIVVPANLVSHKDKKVKGLNELWLEQASENWFRIRQQGRKIMSATPQTDAEVDSCGFYVPRSFQKFARQLEIELAAEREKVRVLTKLEASK